MHLKTDDIIRLELDYDSGTLPPPFSHTFKLRIGFAKNFINTQFDIQYTDRDEITEEEIYGEGFTLDDNYHLKNQSSAFVAWIVPIFLRDTSFESDCSSFFEFRTSQFA